MVLNCYFEFLGLLLVQIGFQKKHNNQSLEVDALEGIKHIIDIYLITIIYLLHAFEGL